MSSELYEFSDATRARQGLLPESRTPEKKFVWAGPGSTPFIRNEAGVLIPMFSQGVSDTTSTTCASVGRISGSPSADHVDTDK